MAQWMIYTKRADFSALSVKHNITPVTARIMTNRGILPEDFESYLSCDMKNLNSPWLFKDMEKAVDILAGKIAEGKNIRVIGDYDIDGVCATYIITDGIRRLGGRADMDIPDRVKDGYGININIIDRAIKAGTDTIVTCDNGIAAVDEIQYAIDKGLTVIVTDHHQVPVDDKGVCVRVKADATINQHQPDCNYPYKSLCGAAVAMKLMEALHEKLNVEYDTDKYIEPAAIATIGDVVDLNGENRIIAKAGLERLRNPGNLGIKALMEVCGIDASRLSSYHIGFIIGPCLNAGGRLETAKKAFSLLAAGSYKEALEKAEELKRLNDERKSMTDEAVEKAGALAELCEDKNVLVLYVKGVHESIAGIVAGRIRERFYKPVIVLTDSDVEGEAKGSGRSIEGYDMFRELSRCQQLFTRFGGHEMAAGLSIPKENIKAFEAMVNENESMTEDILTEKIWIDVKMPFSYISESFVEELSLLEPFGKANEKPLFAEKPVELLGFTIMGKNRNVLKMTLRGEDKSYIQAMYFGDIEELKENITEKYGSKQLDRARMGRDNDIRMAVTYYPQINTYNGKTSVQIVVRQIQI